MHLDSQRLLATSRGETLEAHAQAHLEACSSCQEALQETSRVVGLLGELGEVERHSTPVEPLWWNVGKRLEAPGLLTRLPIPMAGVSRLTQEMLKPRVAAAWAAGVVGLLFGIWLAPRNPSTRTEEPYVGSSLVEERVSLSAMYEDSFTEGNAGAGEPNGETPDGQSDSSKAAENPQTGGQP